MNKEIVEEYIESYVMMLNLTYDYNFHYTVNSLMNKKCIFSIRARRSKEVYSLDLYTIMCYDDKVEILVRSEKDIIISGNIKNICRRMDDLEELLVETIDDSIDYCKAIYK